MAENATWSPVGGWGLLNGRLARVVDLLRQGQRYSTQRVTGNTTLSVLSTAQAVLVDTTAGSVTITLPPAADAVGRLPVTIKKVVAANTLTVAADGGDTIDGAASVSWQASGDSREFLSDGTTWSVLSMSLDPIEQAQRYVTTEVTGGAVTLSTQIYGQHVRAQGGVTVTLPPASENTNRIAVIVSKRGASGEILVSGGTINNTTNSVAISDADDARRFLSNGTGWFTV